MAQQLTPAQLWLRLAQEKLQVARELFDLSYYDDAVSKAYYVMFYAVKAALATRNIEVRRHSGAIVRFGQEFVKTGCIAPHYQRLLAQAMQAREISDYDPAVRASRQDAETAIVHAAEFLQKVSDMLGGVFQ